MTIRYTADHPDRVDHLFLLDSAGLHTGATIAAVQPKTREEALETVRNVSGASPSRVLHFILDDVVRRAQEPARQQYRDSGEPTDVARYLPRVEATTTIVWGEHDGFIPTEHGARMHEAIEGSELIILPDIGHVPQLQAPPTSRRNHEQKPGVPTRENFSSLDKKMCLSICFVPGS